MQRKSKAFTEVIEKHHMARFAAKVYWYMVIELANDSSGGKHGEYWLGGDTIMCSSEKAAKTLANFLNSLGSESYIGKYSCTEYKAGHVEASTDIGWYVDLV